VSATGGLPALQGTPSSQPRNRFSHTPGTGVLEIGLSHPQRAFRPLGAEAAGREKPLTSRQQAVLDYVRSHPTAVIRDIANNAGYRSVSGAFYAFGELRRQGLVRQAQCECCGTWRWVVPE
jgi:hypothetical protein